MKFATAIISAFLLVSSSSLISSAPTSQGSQKNGYLAVFGDSISDTGCLRNLKDSDTIGYWNGRFTDGPVWSDYASEYLGRSLINYSVGGAVVDNYITRNNDSQPSLKIQTKSFVDNKVYRGFLDKFVGIISYQASDLYHYLGNFTDSNFDPNKNVTAVANSVVDSAVRLLDSGVQNVLVWNAPNTEVPLGRMFDAQDIIGQFVSIYNKTLISRLDETKKRYADRISLIDMDKFVRISKSKPITEKLGITNTTGSCTENFGVTSPSIPVCKNPESYYYYDLAHYSVRISYLLGIAIGKGLSRGNKVEFTEAGLLQIIDEFDIKQSTAKKNYYIDHCPSGDCQTNWI
ncbi:hypothetical protein H4219_002434 [Mycoemilia scoparia]|uniref:Uncharacterized protein n=1 Tax=Mycoemilia scoparia TaxID=417184 RepID=A0A9W8DU21_9FUNG|nr:hypothetical protein H4219_002434 [Mycoemilia scoparia]